MKLHISLAAALIVSAGVAFAGEKGEYGKKSAYTDQQKQEVERHLSGEQMEVFKRLDRAGDARISQEEAQQHPQLSQNFSDLDKDGDGQLSAEEFSEWDGAEEN
jgi:hypothetical protein